MSRGKKTPFNTSRNHPGVKSPLTATQTSSWQDLSHILPASDARWRYEVLPHDGESRNYQTNTYLRPEFNVFDDSGQKILFSGQAAPAKPYRWDEASWHIPGVAQLERSTNLLSALPQMYLLALEIGEWLSRPIKYEQKTDDEAEAICKKWREILLWNTPWYNSNDNYNIKYQPENKIWDVLEVTSNLDYQKRIICRLPTFNYGSGDQYAALWFENDTPHAKLQAEYAALAPMLFVMLDKAASEVHSVGYYSRDDCDQYSRDNRQVMFEARDLFVHLQEHARIYQELTRKLGNKS